MSCKCSIDVFPLRQSQCNNNGGTGPTGPQGQRGPRGPAGSGSDFTSESLVYEGVTLPISTTKTITYITNNAYTDAVFTLANGTENSVKYIYVSDISTLPAQIQTTNGTFSLTPDNNQIQLIYNSGWKQISDKAPYYPTTQQGSKLVGTGYVGTSWQGTAVALSADGNTLAVGGYGDDSNIGATMDIYSFVWHVVTTR